MVKWREESIAQAWRLNTGASEGEERAMIIYFSATGNTEHAANEIRLEGEDVVSIEEAVKAGSFRFALRDERLGILAPTYDWCLPSIVSEFLEKLDMEFAEKPYTFYVGTFGTTTGAASSVANAIMKKKGLGFDALFGIRMPDTWTVLFDLSDEGKVAASLRRADEEIAQLKGQLARKERGRHIGITAPAFTGRIGKAIYDGKTRKTSNLSASEACIGCGLCARKCPVDAIRMENELPVWVKDSCAMCLGCLHRCPKHAIRYGDGKATDAHGQYTYRKYAARE